MCGLLYDSRTNAVIRPVSGLDRMGLINVYLNQRGLCKRFASINDVGVLEGERKFRWGNGAHLEGHHGLSELGL